MAIKAVEMIRKIRDENYEKTKNLSQEERLKLLHKHAAEFIGNLERRNNATFQKKNRQASHKPV